MDSNNAPIFLSLQTSLMDLSDTGAIDYCEAQGEQTASSSWETWDALTRAVFKGTVFCEGRGKNNHYFHSMFQEKLISDWDW